MNRKIDGPEILITTKFALFMNNVFSKAKNRLLVAQQNQNTKRWDVSYEVGSTVFLSNSNIKLKTPSMRKLLSWWIGPFEIVINKKKLASQHIV